MNQWIAFIVLDKIWVSDCNLCSLVVILVLVVLIVFGSNTILCCCVEILWSVVRLVIFDVIWLLTILVEVWAKVSKDIKSIQTQCVLRRFHAIDQAKHICGWQLTHSAFPSFWQFGLDGIPRCRSHTMVCSKIDKQIEQPEVLFVTLVRPAMR